MTGVQTCALPICIGFAAVGETYTPDQLSQYAWVNQALKCGQAAQDWQTIGTAAQAYTQNALVPFPTGSIPN